MKLLKLGVAAAIASATLPTAANAATVVSTTLESAVLNQGANNSFTIAIADGNLTPAAGSTQFTELLTFTTDVGGLLNVLISTVTGENGDINDTDFGNIFLTGTGITGQVNIPNFTPDPSESNNRNNIPLVGPGTFTLSISGTPASQNAALGGTLAFRSVAAVPEPGTWALMLLGFGAVGFSMRRRRQTGAHIYQAA